MDIESQIYIVVGAFGGICGILIVVVGILVCLVQGLQSRLKRIENQINSESSKQTATINRKIEVTNDTDYAFNEPSIQSGEVLSRRGFMMSPDLVSPRLKSIGGGMYGGSNREPSYGSAITNLDSTDGTKDATNDFIVSPHLHPTHLNPMTQSPLNITARRTSSSINHDFPSNNQFEASVPDNRRPSQFNRNIVLGNSNSHMASTEFPSIDYEDVRSFKHDNNSRHNY